MRIDFIAFEREHEDYLNELRQKLLNVFEEPRPDMSEDELFVAHLVVSMKLLASMFACMDPYDLRFSREEFELCVSRLRAKALAERFFKETQEHKGD